MPEREVNPAMDIRRYCPADEEAVWALHNEALQQVHAHLGNGAWDDDLHAIGQTYLRAGGEFLVGTIDGQVVAMGALLRIDETTAELKRMRISPAHQRRGLGREMLRRLEQRAREIGFARVVLDTTAGQTAARGLYESGGYVETGRHRLGGFDVLTYARNLNEGG